MLRTLLKLEPAKRFYIFELVLLLTASVKAFAAPFLVADPYPAGLDQFTMPVSFILKGLSANPLSVAATINQDGTIQLRYDLAQQPHGSFTVIADAVNVFGGVSPDSAPFTFTSGVPAVLTNLRIVP
jgi:hypothetical protein